jgi:predicted methyltransferase
VLLSAYQVRPLLEFRKKAAVTAASSVDLGISKVEVQLTEEGVVFPARLVTWSELDEIQEQDRRVFFVTESGIQPVQTYSETTGWVRALCPTRSAPTVLVSGIPMHRIKETDPMVDTKSKIAALGLLRGRVLDTATGLGYTAILAARTAKEVVTIELDPAAIEIARLNPWSAELFNRKNIKQIIGNAVEEIRKLGPGSFEHVIHDPPTLSLGGDLYSEEFYRSVHRVMRRNGKLFHYIGDPNSGIGKKLYPGVMKRLNAAGFKSVKRREEAYGVTADA